MSDQFPPTGPSHGQPPLPGQPPYGAPGQPPYGAPGQPPYGAPQPPPGAPGQPPYGAPGQPPTGAPVPPAYSAPQPPYGAPLPPAGQPSPAQPGYPAPEYLTQGGGAPLPAGPAPSRRGRRIALLAGAVVGVGALGAAATWAVMTLSGGGPQPAEALPDTTLGYLSIDLDPSASQKIEAIKMLKKFPGFDDSVDIQSGDDLRRTVFDLAQEQSECANLDYDDDIATWIGDRAAVAAVEVDGKPVPAIVIQVTDEKAADAGLTQLAHCDATGDAEEAGDESTLGWAIADGFAIVSEDDATARQIVDDAASGPLTEDESYTRWTDALGDRGIVTMYAAPAAADLLADNLDDLGSLGMAPGDPLDYMTEESAFAPGADDSTDAAKRALKDFAGMAATLRFNDGSLEFEVVGDPGESLKVYGDGSGANVLATLPEDTGLAFGMQFADGWVTSLAETLVEQVGDGTTVDDLMAEMESATGMDMPDDLETLTGDSLVFAVGSDIDLTAMEQSTDGTGVPVGVKIHGDPAAIEDVLDKLRDMMPGEAGDIIASESSDEMIAIAPDDDYRAALIEDGGLGDTDAFREIVPHADDASVVFYVNFDANDWLTELAGDDQEVADNLEPLSGLGMSTWVEGDASHALLRLTTD